jgi:hypothetical protein
MQLLGRNTTWVMVTVTCLPEVDNFDFPQPAVMSSTWLTVRGMVNMFSCAAPFPNVCLQQSRSHFSNFLPLILRAVSEVITSTWLTTPSCLIFPITCYYCFLPCLQHS